MNTTRNDSRLLDFSVTYYHIAAQAVVRELRPLLRAKAGGRVQTSPFNPKRL